MSIVEEKAVSIHTDFSEMLLMISFLSVRRRHTRYIGDWSSDVCSSDLHHRRSHHASHPRKQWRRCLAKAHQKGWECLLPSRSHHGQLSETRGRRDHRLRTIHAACQK